MSTVPHPSRWAWDEPISPDELRRDAERYYEAIFARRRKRCRRQVPTTLLLRHGRAAGCLLDDGRRDHYDLITVGSRERGRLRSALFGGLGQKLERRSPVPVLVVPVPTTDVRGSERGRGRELGLLRVNRLYRHGSAPHEAARLSIQLVPRVAVEFRRRRQPLGSAARPVTPADSATLRSVVVGVAPSASQSVPTTRDRAR